MGEYTGLVMFLWIVGAPTVGILLMSMWTPRRSALQSGYGAAPAHREDRTAYASRDANRPL